MKCCWGAVNRPSQALPCLFVCLFVCLLVRSFVCFYTHLQDTHFRWKLKWPSALLGALRNENICQFCSCRIKTESQTWKEMTAVEWFTFIKMLSTLKQCCPQESLWGANSTSAAGILWYAILFVPLNIQITTSGILFCGWWNVDTCLV